jgi:hypothetical protein
MTAPVVHGDWNPEAQEKRWRDALTTARFGQDQLEPKLGAPQSNFYVLCLAELDAGTYFTKPEFFASQAAFVDVLRRLMAEPTSPSRPVPDLQAYQAAQKWWLEFVIKEYVKVG